MKTVIKTLFVWLLLCAIPFQGYASARMACGAMASQQGPAAAPPATLAAHAHPASSSAHPQHHVIAAGHESAAGLPLASHASPATHGSGSPSDQSDHGASPQHGKCGSVGGCCIAFALPPAPQPVLATSSAVASSVPFVDRFVPDTVPGLLERPPRATLS